jgi:hypothetical protein
VDADTTAPRRAELEAALLAASSPGGEEPAEAAVATTVASVGATEASAVLDEAPVVAEGAEVWNASVWDLRWTCSLPLKG